MGVGVVVFKDGKILLGKRKNAHGDGTYAWPGGHLEHLESIIGCAKREVKEETDLEIENVRFLRVYNFKEYAPKHYLDICMVADWKNGEPKVMEPEKCESWAWYSLDQLPAPLFPVEPSAIEALRTGKNFFDN